VDAELAPDSIVSRADGLIVETLGEEVVMLDPGSDRYLRLNPTGRLLWEALSQPATVAELGERLAGAFGISPARAREDTIAFVASLMEHGAVRVSPEGH
jgi:Coenzyme PQQ synthesis protein D (PqqD)